MRSARPAPPTPRAYARADSPWRLRLRLLPRRTCRKEASMLEGSTISSMIYPTLRINYCLLLLIRGLQSPGPASSNRFRPTKPYPTLYFSVFRPLRTAVTAACPLGSTVGTSPRCCTPILISFRLLFRREPIFEFEFEASLFAFDIETPPFGFALLLPR